MSLFYSIFNSIQKYVVVLVRNLSILYVNICASCNKRHILSNNPNKKLKTLSRDCVMKPSYIHLFLQSHAHPPRLAVPNENSLNFLKGNHSHPLHTGVQTYCETTLSGREPMSTEVNHSSNKNNQHSQDTVYPLQANREIMS